MNRDCSTLLLREAISHFLPGCNYSVSPSQGGANNIMQYLHDPIGEVSYILRIYNNGNDSERVRYEHEILSLLRQFKLSFRIPTPILALNNSPHVLLSNGAEASIFELIPGYLPKLTHIRQIGKAAGELNTALANIQPYSPSPNPPYYDLYSVHHAITRDLFLVTMRSSEFDSVKEEVNKLLQEIAEMEMTLENLLEMNLPKQLIHGDLHYDNVLILDGSISGVLDFEFCAMDWRAMELAICLSKYAGEKEALQYFSDFIGGYFEYGVLNPFEMKVVPDLIILRIISNAVYFVGRFIAKEDTISTISNKCATYIARIQWIKANRDVIVTMIENHS